MDMSLQDNSFNKFLLAIKAILPADNIILKTIQRFAYGTDASFYRLVPKVVLRIDNEDELSQVLSIAKLNSIAITFRAAGTSLSGQAITDSVLIILSSAWQSIRVLDNGNKISLQPGVIGANANRALAEYGRKIGPDPASINSCKIGGIAANNSSGMCCGVKDNSYHTLADIKLVFADGSQLDTADKTSITNFKSSHKVFIDELMAIANEIKTDTKLFDKIKHKYRLKNTTGYGVNALIEFNDAIDIISHLMIGSEGTLAFIADITYNTVKVMPNKAAGLYIFDNTQVACELVHVLSTENVLAIELMDNRALNAVTTQLTDLMPYQQLTDNNVGLLIELGAESAEQLEIIQQRILSHINAFQRHIISAKLFTTNPDVIESLWKIRKGMFPAVGARRNVGTTVVIEDIALPIERLAEGIEDLHRLFKKYNYDEAIIFGHALAGNLHFVFTQAFDTNEQVNRYRDFMNAVTTMVAIDYKGSLKAEHGTGRNMAPFVELEWGAEIYQMMCRIKKLFDPQGILNPGVIINDDVNAHITHMKTMSPADELIDKCIECGFCESVCPSQELTLTPRQRIAVWRRITELASLKKNNALTELDEAQYKSLREEYQYFGIDSCAATGICGQECPVGIDTGQFIKSLRREQNSDKKYANKLAQVMANNFNSITGVAKFGLNSVSMLENVLGSKNTKKTFNMMNSITNDLIPIWYPAWPKGAVSANEAAGDLVGESTERFSDKVIYIPSCANRVFSADSKASDQRPIQAVMQSILAKAQLQMVIPKNIANMCCGMPWESKGFGQIAQQKQQEFLAMIDEVSEQGKWPVVTDASPCALTLNNDAMNDRSTMKANNIKVFEASEFMAKFVLDKLNIVKSSASFMLHTTCSSKKMDEGKYLQHIVTQCSDNINIPQNISCCGFAGDKGFSLPELNENALKSLAEQVPSGCERGLSNSRTCEIGLTEHSKISYQSFLYLLDEVSLSR